MSRQGKEHAYGPYPNRNAWRVVVVRADGTRFAQTFESRAAAEQEIAKIRNAIDSRTLGDAVTDYLESLRANGARASSLETVRIRLFGILRLREGDRLLRGVTPRLAAKLYQQRIAEGVSAATHRGELGCAVRCFEHARVKRGWIPSNPFENVEPTGIPGRGKPQLRVDEAKRLLRVLVADKSPEATAVMMTLLMGLRAHEVVQRVGRDVDNGGTLLWISTSKTRAGVRQIVIPSLLRGRILELVKGSDERLFSLNRFQLWHVTQKFAKAAGVPRVTPHGLRGTFATLALTGGLFSLGAPMRPQELAPQFGHNDGGATMRRHYLAPGAEQSSDVSRLEEILGNDTIDGVPPDEGGSLDLN